MGEMTKMTFPPKIAEAMRSCPVQETFGDDARLAVPWPRAECQVAKYHSPYPLLTHLIPLIPEAWAPVNVDTEHILACGTCRDSLRVMQHLLWESNGALAWTVRREFGNRVRELAEQSWRTFKGLPVEMVSSG